MKVTKLSDLGKMAQMGESTLVSDKPQIVLGLATCGIAAGGMPLKDFAEQYLAENDVKADIVSVGCIGLCHAEPLVDIKLPGKPRVTYDYMDTDKLKKILDEHLVGGQPVKELAMAQLSDELSQCVDGTIDFAEKYHAERIAESRKRYKEIRDTGKFDLFFTQIGAFLAKESISLTKTE